MDNRSKTLVAGALLGAVTGLLAALLLQRQAEKKGTDLSISTGEGLKIGLLVVGLLRAITSLDDK